MDGLIDFLSSRYRRLAEVGVGSYTRVALALRDRGVSVLTTDIRPQGSECHVEMDDIWRPRLDLYRDVEAIYAVRPPPELVPPLRELALRVGADLIIKPLAGEAADGEVVNVGRSFFYVFPFGKGQP